MINRLFRHPPSPMTIHHDFESGNCRLPSNVKPKGVEMRFIWVFLGAILASQATGQPSSPPCDGSGFRHMCTGMHTEPSGARYIGEFRNNRYHGQGIWHDTIGGRYVGEFKNGGQDGFGVYYFRDGCKYVGNWRDGKKHGHGTEDCPNGHKISGTFYNGNFQQPAPQENTNLTCFNLGGMLVCQRPDGRQVQCIRIGPQIQCD
jgi:hypothetical protein